MAQHEQTPFDLPEIHWTEIPFEPLTRTVLAVYGDQPKIGLAATETGDLLRTVDDYHVSNEEIIKLVDSLFGTDPKVHEVARKGIRFLNREALQSSLILPLSRIEPTERAELIDELLAMAGRNSVVTMDRQELYAQELAQTIKANFDTIAAQESQNLINNAMGLGPAVPNYEATQLRWLTSIRLTILAQTAVNNISPPAASVVS